MIDVTRMEGNMVGYCKQLREIGMEGGVSKYRGKKRRSEEEGDGILPY